MPVLIKVSQNQIKEAKSFGKFYATWGLTPEITLLWGLAPEINSLKNLDGMVVVEDNPGGWGLIQTEFLAGFVP